SLGGQRGFAGVEWRGRHRRRPRLLWNDGRLVQGRRRSHWRAAVAVQDRLGHHRPTDHVQRPGRSSVCRRAFRRRRLVGRDRRRRSRRTRLVGRAPPRPRDEGSAVQDDQGRHALRLRTMTSVVTPRQERLVLLVPLVTLLMVSVAKSGIVSAFAATADATTLPRLAEPKTLTS